MLTKEDLINQENFLRYKVRNNIPLSDLEQEQFNSMSQTEEEVVWENEPTE